MSKRKLAISTQVAIREYTIGAGKVKILYDLWSKAEGNEVKINQDPITMEIGFDEIKHLKQPEASKYFNNKKAGAKEKFEDLDHYIESKDAFFVSMREFLSEFDKVIDAHLKENNA